MAGYAAIARIERPRVHAREPHEAASLTTDTSVRDLRASDPPDLGVVVAALRERVGELRTELDQLTFFLLDPDSWRR